MCNFFRISCMHAQSFFLTTRSEFDSLFLRLISLISLFVAREEIAPLLFWLLFEWTFFIHFVCRGKICVVVICTIMIIDHWSFFLQVPDDGRPPYGYGMAMGAYGRLWALIARCHRVGACQRVYYGWWWWEVIEWPEEDGLCKTSFLQVTNLLNTFETPWIDYIPPIFPL